MVVEAQLTLLLRLAAASGPNGRRSSAKLLLDCAPLRQLAECSALACRPDVLSAASRARREGSFRWVQQVAADCRGPSQGAALHVLDPG